MRPLWHVLYGLFFSIILYLFNFNFLEISVFFLASIFLIDIDHLPRFIFSKRSINPFKFLSWHNELKNKWLKFSKNERSKYKKPLFFFHNIETLVILFIVSIYFNIVFFIFLGFLFHLICDLIIQKYLGLEKYYKLSLIYTLVKNKNKKDFF